MEAFRHILIPTDFGESAQLAEDYAIAFAAKFGARVTLLHVHVPPVAYAGGFYVPFVELEGAAEKALEEAFAKLRARCLESDRAIAVGSPAERILAVAAEQGADLIVMGTHGHKGLSRAILGSVAEKVVRLSPVPVLTVRAHGPTNA